MDARVLEAQSWVNQEFVNRPGFVPAPENGVTGWSTMYALTRGLQIALGVSPPSDSFGPGTKAAVGAISPIGISSSTNSSVVRVLQCALWCKGYNAGNIDGLFGAILQSGVEAVQDNLGVPTSGTVDAKLFKSLLTMDAYTLVGAGAVTVRDVQRWMNASYLDRDWFEIIPTDGRFSRDVQKSLVYAIQSELRVAGANGNYGPGTRAAVAAAPTISVGSSDALGSRWVRLFQAALRFNGLSSAFGGVFNAADSASVANFQDFCVLPVTGASNYSTWSSLLVSNGDPERRGRAADCVTTITPERAATLVADGRIIVGRYLTNAGGSTSLNKKIQPGELSAILAAGLRVFPIYQTAASSASYFGYQQGLIDAERACDAAAGYGFLRGSHIYFAVDFDALDGDITSGVLPYFRGVASRMVDLGSRYRVGVYGARNVCTQVSKAGYSSRSFVSGMSVGFSGNLGYALPSNWAFDQVSTVALGSASGRIEIDNDIYSGRDTGSSAVLPPASVLDVDFDAESIGDLRADIESYCADVSSNTVGLKNGDPSECLAALMAQDRLVTSLARAYGMRKALIQAVSFWEYWKTTYLDDVADASVMAWYVYKIQLEEWEKNPSGVPPRPPVIAAEDSSTGFAQIFASTAISAFNWRLSNGMASGAPLDGGDWHQVWDVWQRLREDVSYCLSAVPGVLLWGADLVGIAGPSLTYTPSEVRRIIARYNGSGAAAEAYGYEVKGVYDIFEFYNAALR